MTVCLMHVSLVRATSEASKLQIISDMTSLESSLSNFLSRMSSESNGSHLSLKDCDTLFYAFRHYRALILQPWSAWENPENIKKNWPMPALVMVHVLLARSDTLPLPNELKKMTQVSYVNWIVSACEGSPQLFHHQMPSTMLKLVQEWVSNHDMSHASSNDQEAFKCLKICFRYLPQDR